MQWYKKVTLEDRDDRIWMPRPLSCLVFENWDTEEQIWTHWLIALPIWFFFLLKSHRIHIRRGRGYPPKHLKRDLLNHAIRNYPEDDQRAINNYLRNLRNDL